MNGIYPTDLTNNRWQYIEKTLLFEERKRKYDLKEIWKGLLYLVKTGCQWGVCSLLMHILKNLCSSVKIIIADGGYRGQLAENIRNTFGYVLQSLSAVIKNKDSNRSKADG